MKVRVFHDTSGFVRNLDVTDRPCPAITCQPNHYQVRIEGGALMEMKIKEFGKREQDGMKTIDLDTDPAPSIMAHGLGGVSHSQYYLEGESSSIPTPADKPPYSVPTMDQVRAVPWNGLTVASTFSGGGGSSTGYRMAGYKVLWASEFIEAARKTYAANMNPDTVLDGRDIRTVEPESILDAIGMGPGELDLLDGSPPCASFSTAGSREKGWGKVKKYSDGTQRTDDLFFEFSRLIRGLQPKTFVAENVSGLVKGTAKGYFLEILADLKACGYQVKCKVLDAQWLGVPQQRQRTIFVGVRNDIDFPPVHPSPLAYRYSVRDAIPEAMTVPYLTTGKQPVRRTARKPCPSVCSSNIGGAGNIVETKMEKRKFTIAELKRICGFPDDFILQGTYAQQWERLGRAVPPVMMSHIAAAIRDGILQGSAACVD